MSARARVRLLWDVLRTSADFAWALRHAETRRRTLEVLRFMASSAENTELTVAAVLLVLLRSRPRGGGTRRW